MNKHTRIVHVGGLAAMPAGDRDLRTIPGQSSSLRVQMLLDRFDYRAPAPDDPDWVRSVRLGRASTVSYDSGRRT